MTVDDVRDALRDACDRAGSQRAWAQLHGIQPSYVGDVLSRGRPPGPAILRSLGIVMTVTYERVEWR